VEPGLLSAGRVGRPHGLDGSFHVTRPRARLLELGRTVVVGGESAEVVRRAGTDARPILRLGGRDGIEAIEALRGEELWVSRDDSPPLGEDEWLAEDLEGCLVVDGEREVGVVKRLLAYPSCEVLEVARPAAPDGEGASGRPVDLLVPLVSDAVRDVDVGARRIDVDLAFLGEQS
jgi:16S rRNA processing protein RimM